MSFSCTLSPQEIINMYFRGEDSIISDFESEWSTHVKHIIKVGRKTDHIYMQSIGNYRLSYYIEKEFNFIVHPKNFEFLSYTQSKFMELAKMETAMLVTKYEDLHVYEIEMAIIKLLFTYFSVYSINAISGSPQWNVTSADITLVINEILDSDLSELKKQIDIITPGLQIIVPQKAVKQKFDKIQPTCAQDLLEVIDDSMSQAEKRRAIMLAWNLPTERAARTYMQKYGLTRSYAKSDKKSLQEKTTTDNSMNIIQEYETQIYTLQKQVSQLLADNEKLQSEINELRKSQGQPEQEIKQSNERVKQQAIFSKNLIPRKKQTVEFDKPDNDYSSMSADEMFSDWLEQQEKIAECEKEIEEKKHTEVKAPYTDIMIPECNSIEMQKLNRLWNK